jgi:Phage integrase, N-terminal SAM-like domain
MMGRADRGEPRTTRERFADWFDEWLRRHHSAGKGTRADYRRHGELRLKPFFGPMRLSVISVQTVTDFVAEMVERVEAGQLASKTVNNALTCLSTSMKEAVALGKIVSNPATTFRTYRSATSSATGWAGMRSPSTSMPALIPTGPLAEVLIAPACASARRSACAGTTSTSPGR